jgi:hypothetical protein
MEKIFRFCRENKWNKVLEYVNQYPLMGNHSMTMDNHITTTIIHQAITSKGDTAVRARVISTILKHTPEAAQTKNGYGSMPLHVIAQRNTKIDSNTKERLINEIIDAYPEALTEAGGVGKRTPLHIIFTGTFALSCICSEISKKNSHCVFRTYRLRVGPPHETHGRSRSQGLLYEGQARVPSGPRRLPPPHFAR